MATEKTGVMSFNELDGLNAQMETIATIKAGVQLLNEKEFVYGKIPEKIFHVSTPQDFVDSATLSCSGFISKEVSESIEYYCSKYVSVTYYGEYNGDIVRTGGVNPTNLGDYYSFTIPINSTGFKIDATNERLGFIDGEYVQNTLLLTTSENWGSGEYQDYKDITWINEDVVLDFDSLDYNDKRTLNFPTHFDFIVGEQVNLYKDGLVNARYLSELSLNTDGFTGYNIVVKDDSILFDFSSITTQNDYFNRVYLNNKITAKNIGDKLLSFTVNEVPTNPISDSNILFVGDSLIARESLTAYFIEELNNTYGLTNYKLVGRLVEGGNASNRYEGVGGYAWQNYTDNPTTLPSSYPNNYFWDTTDINITKYMTDYCGGVDLDYLICNIGWNQLVNPDFIISMSEIKEKALYFIDKVHSEYPNCKIMLGGIQSTYPYANKETVNKYRSFMFELSYIYNEIAIDSNYSSFVKFVSNSCTFNSKLGHELTNDTTLTSDEYCTDLVHPNDSIGFPFYAKNYLRALFGFES